jgi:hypothetical protein
VLIFSAQSYRLNVVTLNLREQRASVELVRRDDESPSNSGTSKSKGVPDSRLCGRVDECGQADVTAGSSGLGGCFGSDLFEPESTVACEVVL